MDYLSIWGSITEYNLDHIQQIQNLLLRIIFRLHKWYDGIDMIQHLKSSNNQRELIEWWSWDISMFCRMQHFRQVTKSQPMLIVAYFKVPLYAARSSKQGHFNSYPLDKMAALLQTIFSDAFSWMKIYVFWLEFHWNFFLRVQCWFIVN